MRTDVRLFGRLKESQRREGVARETMRIAGESALRDASPADLIAMPILQGKGRGRRFESVRGLCKGPANRGFLVCVQSAWRAIRPGMEPFMELPRREVGQASAGIGSPRDFAVRASLR